MTAPQYMASGGVVFQREHVPMTIQAARLGVSLHRMNASHWLTNGEERTLPARIALAKTEMALADELEAAIRAATQPERLVA